MTDHPTKAMIFAAGLGTRLWPLTKDIPKPLIPVLGQPLIIHTIGFLQSQGVREIVINLHYRAKKIMDVLGNGRQFGVNLIYSYEKKILGTGGGLKKAEQHLSDGTFYLINSDIVADVNLLDVFSYHRRNGAMATMVLRNDPHAESYGVIGLDRDGRIRQFLNKLPPVDGYKVKTYMFTGVHVLEPDIFRYIPARGFSSITELMYPRLLQEGEKGYGFVMNGYWADLGTPENYARALRDINAGKVKTFFSR